jgi:hypothetical protein
MEAPTASPIILMGLFQYFKHCRFTSTINARLLFHTMRTAAK